MDINLAHVLEEVRHAFARYEQALVENDVDTLDALFWDSAHTLRYGATENLYGYQQIAAFRSARPATGLAREVLHTVVTTYGEDFATTHIEFQRTGITTPGRQSQVWARMPEGWRVVAAHVSLLHTPA